MDVAQNRSLQLNWNPHRRYGVSLTLAGHGYPYVIPTTPRLPITQTHPSTCDLWWNEVQQCGKQLYTAHHKIPIMGHRIADCNAFSENLDQALEHAYQNHQITPLSWQLLPSGHWPISLASGAGLLIPELSDSGKESDF